MATSPAPSAKRHASRCPVTGRFVRAAVSAPVVAAPAPVVVPVIDDVPVVSAPVVEAPAIFSLTADQDAWLRREERLAAADARARAATRRGSAVLFIAAACVVLAFVVVALFTGPQASAHAGIDRTRCDQLASQGSHAWQVEAVRLTAMTGTRHTVGSLSASCASR